MTIGTTYSPIDQVLDIKNRAEALEQKARALWEWKDRELGDAAEELNIDLSAFAESLGKNPVFNELLPMEDDYALLWAMFLKDGEPGTEAWDNDWLEGSDLRALPLLDFLVVLAALGSQQALWFLEGYTRCLDQGKSTEAAEELGNAVRHLTSGEKAMALVNQLQLPRTTH